MSHAMETPSTGASRRCCLLDLPVIGYEEAWDLQRRLVGARLDGSIDRDVVLLLEHLPVFTIGRRGGLDNLRASESFLKAREIPVLQVERGGDITYHGPGQLVLYPIVDLRATKCRVVQFVNYLEEIMIRTLSEWGIDAGRDPANRGVWVGPAKIGSLGIAVRRSVSFHGLALNVNTALEPFGWINPCGLPDVSVTSMQQESGRVIAMAEARRAITSRFQEVMDVETEQIGLDQLYELLDHAEAR